MSASPLQTMHADTVSSPTTSCSRLKAAWFQNDPLADGLDFGLATDRQRHLERLPRLAELKRLAETTSLSIHLKRTEPRTARTDMLPYSIDVVCLDQTGIVSGLSGFFATRGIDIAEVSTRSYPAAHTGAPMFAVQMIINVPKRLQLAHLPL